MCGSGRGGVGRPEPDGSQVTCDEDGPPYLRGLLEVECTGLGDGPDVGGEGGGEEEEMKLSHRDLGHGGCR